MLDNICRTDSVDSGWIWLLWCVMHKEIQFKRTAKEKYECNARQMYAFILVVRFVIYGNI